MVANYLKAENDLKEVLEENLNSLNGLLTTIDSYITLKDETIVGVKHWLLAHNDENEIDLEAKEKLEKLGYVYSNELNSLNWQNKKIKYSNIVEESEKDKKLLMDEKNKYEAELKKLKIF